MDAQMVSPSLSGSVFQAQRAAATPKLSAGEVIPLAREELRRFEALLAELAPEDWEQPTDCALWSVRDIVAHQAGHVRSLTRVGEFIDQFNPFNARAYLRRGMNPLDAANQRQVDLRAARTPAELSAEIRADADVSLSERQRFPALLRQLPIPTLGTPRFMSIGSLIDLIYTRDMWMHRADICRATGREMVLTVDHDGRIVALVLRDLERSLARRLDGRAVIFRLEGKIGSAWSIGAGQAASAAISLDALEFNRLASGRLGAQQALEQGLVRIEGDEVLGRLALQNAVVLY